MTAPPVITQCQCVKECGVCIPCPRQMTAEDLLCNECREDRHGGWHWCHKNDAQKLAVAK